MKKLIIIITAIVIVCGVLFLAYYGFEALILLPQTKADMQFVEDVTAILDDAGEIDFAEYARFDWDTMYYSWNEYGPYMEMKDFLDEDVIKGLRYGTSEQYNHILFIKDRHVVKQYMIKTSLQMDINKYKTQTENENIVIDKYGDITGVLFSRDQSCFEGMNENGKGYILYHKE